MHHKTEWAELAISVTPEYSDAVANFLIEQGSNGIVEEEDDKNREGYVTLKAYLKNDCHVDKALRKIELYLKSLYEIRKEKTAVPEIIINQIPDEDWNKKWKSFFEPVKVTPRIVIKPSWRKYRQQWDEIIIELDPGMAFGTGTHPSTRMCLRAIEKLTAIFQGKKNTGLLDVGTGSGILAIAASLLGIEKVVGIDIDHQAILCAQKNVKKNNAAENISLSTTSLNKIEGIFPIVVANIFPHVLIDMKEKLSARLDGGGFLILSGILREKAAEVVAAFSAGFKVYEELNEEEWTCLVFQKT